MSQSFREYIAARDVTNSVVGDFIYFAQRDPNFPEIQTKAQLVRYLSAIAASSLERLGAAGAWQTYRTVIRGQKESPAVAKSHDLLENTVG